MDGGADTMLTRHIFLIGMSGSGKSSLGRRTATTMGLSYLDTDTMINEVLGGTTVEIFEKFGENAFRTAERNLLIWLTRQPPCIISTGGGMVIREENRAIMRNWGHIVLIDRPLEEILSDIKLDRRPLLAARGLDGVKEMYEQRIGIYRSAADASIVNNVSYYDSLAQLERVINRLCPP